MGLPQRTIFFSIGIYFCGHVVSPCGGHRKEPMWWAQKRAHVDWGARTELEMILFIPLLAFLSPLVFMLRLNKDVAE
jgi:hypothetical protein